MGGPGPTPQCLSSGRRLRLGFVTLPLKAPRLRQQIVDVVVLFEIAKALYEGLLAQLRDFLKIDERLVSSAQGGKRASIDVVEACREATVRGIAEELHVQGIRAPRGDMWHPTAVSRLLTRIEGAGK